jgi:type IV pilus assembly protein PilC
MAKELKKQYSARELSAFCLQISILLHAAIPLDEGLSVMAEDALTEDEKNKLLTMSEEVELGKPFSVVLEEAGVYPPYVISMAKLGEETGTLDEIMKSLSEYYEKEYILMKNIKSALTYPVIMIFMLLVVLFVLFTKVMPIFENVYEQLGAQMSPISLYATKLGGIFCGIALIAGTALAVISLIIWVFSKNGKKISVVNNLFNVIKKKSRIALAVANRRFTSVLSLTLHSGMELEKGMELAEKLVENPAVEEKIVTCKDQLEVGDDYYTAMKDTGLFKGFYIQMIKVGVRSGRLDTVMDEISGHYEEEADTAIEHMVNRFEPTMVAVLAVSVGLILLSVMLPLVGVLFAIG